MIDFENLPNRSWTDKQAYKILSSALSRSQDRDFEKLVLDLIRIIWPSAAPAPSLGWIDNSGIDLLVWDDLTPYPLVVQCKGFKVPEESVGGVQISQCVNSISKFRKSGIKAEQYLLIHNRTARNEKLRETIEKELSQLVKSRQVQSAQLWDKTTLIKKALNYALYLSREAITNQKTRIQDYNDNQIYEPIKKVPYVLSYFTFGPNQLKSKTSDKIKKDDPTKEILNPNISNLTLMIGEAGYGKTTALLRSFSEQFDLVPIYIPASTIPKNVSANTRDLLRHCIKVEDIINIPPTANLDIFTLVFEAAIHNILTNESESSPIVILLDGLDESVYISHRGGIHSLFNQLRHISVPVVLTARKEFWLERQTAFSQSFGSIATVNLPANKRVKMIELQAWNQEEILELAIVYKNSLKEPSEKRNVDLFINLVKDGKYEDFYGDIPRRPLFLRFILETITQKGVKQTGKAKLYFDWAKLKIERDISLPMKWGGVGRLPIISNSESEDETLNLSFLAMMLAAHNMIQIQKDMTVDLLPECEIDEVLSSDNKLKHVQDPLGLFLNSLLFPIPRQLPGQSLKIRFAHRTYQEFFLAYYLMANPEELRKGYKFPDTVMKFLVDIEKEGLDEN